MFQSMATTHQPATDLGFLLHKHPDRLHETELSFGKAHVFFPEASEARCEAVLLMDVDPVGLVREGRRRRAARPLRQRPALRRLVVPLGGDEQGAPDGHGGDVARAA